MSKRYEVTTRTQYTMEVDSETFAQLLTLSVKKKANPNSVNVVGYINVKVETGSSNLVKIVVGTDDPNDSVRGGAGDPFEPDFQRTNRLQNQQFRENMRKLNIEFTEQQVIQIFNIAEVTGTAGALRIPLTILQCADIDINASYLGEPALISPVTECECDCDSKIFKSNAVNTFIEVDTDDLEEAIDILRNVDISGAFDETQLCFNRNNIVKKITESCHCSCE